MHDSPTVEVLLGHGRFIRLLARELAQDAHAAEDLAQEAQARWLERGAAGLAQPRAWLRRVVRNLAINQAVAERRRRAREAATARDEASPSVSESVAEAELLQAVGAAVLALEEPYRSTILARYYHGLDARELAQESGTPLATVRSREQRALARLRERLDREQGGREGWALALARLGGGAAPAAIPLWFALTCVAGSLALWVVAWQVRAARSAVGAPSATLTEASLASSPPASGARAPAPTTAPAGSARVASATSSPAASQASSIDPSLALVKGRLLLEDGSPAVHTQVVIEGFQSDDERVQRFGLPQDWQNPTTETGDDGSFALSFVPPGAFEFLLYTTRPEHASARWWWSELRPGVVKDIGDAVLFVAGVVEGRLVDANGRALGGASGGGWRVSAESVGLDDRAGRDETTVSAEVAPDGSFRLEGVHPGLDALHASSNAARIDGPNVRIAPGQHVTVDLTYRGPDLERRVTVLVSTSGIAPFRVPSTENVHLLGSDRSAHVPDGTASTYVFDDVEPGAYPVVIDDPRCRPWRQDGVRTGVPIRARVRGSAALALTVLAEDGLTPVPAFSVSLRALGDGAPSDEHIVHDGSEPLAEGVLADVYPGDYSVTVRAGERSAHAGVAELGAGEVRALTLRFESRPSQIAGRVLRPSGEPVALARVRLIRPALVGDSDATMILPATGSVTTTPERFRHEIAVVESDASGAFRFEAPDPGAYLIEASVDETRVFLPSFVLAAGEARTGIELELGAPASLRGRALGPTGANFEGLALSLRPTGPGNELARLMTPAKVLPLASDGSFECESAPVGEFEVWLALPIRSVSFRSNRTVVDIGSGSRSSGGPARTLIADERLVGRVELAAGVPLERDFDVAALFPGAVTLTVETGGEPCADLEVTLVAHDRGGPDANTRRTVPVDSHGVTQPAIVFAGSWDVFVHSFEAHRLYAHPAVIEVAPASRVEVVVPLRGHAGELTCIDANGQPWAGQDFLVGDAEQRFALPSPLRTDANGRLELVLSPGAYRLSRLTRERGAKAAVAEFHWTENGPAEPQVHF